MAIIKTGNNRGPRNQGGFNSQGHRGNNNPQPLQDNYSNAQQQYPHSDRGQTNFNNRAQRGRGEYYKGQRGIFYKPRNQYKGNYQYRYLNYRNQR